MSFRHMAIHPGEGSRRDQRANALLIPLSRATNANSQLVHGGRLPRNDPIALAGRKMQGVRFDQMSLLQGRCFSRFSIVSDYCASAEPSAGTPTGNAKSIHPERWQTEAPSLIANSPARRTRRLGS